MLVPEASLGRAGHIVTGRERSFQRQAPALLRVGHRLTLFASNHPQAAIPGQVPLPPSHLSWHEDHLTFGKAYEIVVHAVV